MKKFLKAVMLAIIGATLLWGTAQAVTISFTDSYFNWPNWDVQNSDLNGTPDFLGGTAEVSDAGYLTSLSFDVKAAQSGTAYLTLFRKLTAADLFVDSNADNVWDYVVKSLGHAGEASVDYDLYNVNQPLGEHGPDVETSSRPVSSDEASEPSGPVRVA